MTPLPDATAPVAALVDRAATALDDELVGVARVLASVRHAVAGRVAVVFQPAEEALKSARAMIGDGLLERVPPASATPCTAAPRRSARSWWRPVPAGPGSTPATSTCPAAGRTRSGCAARSRTCLLWSVRPTPGRWPASCGTCGTRCAGTAPGARVSFDGPPFPAMVCSLRAAYPFNGEDFALFLERVPGAMVFLGVANETAGIAGVPHAPNFAADERAVGIGVRAMTGLILERLGAAA